MSLIKKRIQLMSRAKPDANDLTFTGHLRELRKRFLRLLVVFIALFVAGMFLSDKIIDTVVSLGHLCILNGRGIGIKAMVIYFGLKCCFHSQ